MDELESIEQLRMIICDVNVDELSANIQWREARMSPAWVDAWQKAAAYALRDIEQELNDRYIALPVDMDGEPWHIGDMVDGHGKVHGMGLDMFGWHFVNVDNAINPELYRHAKPRTLEDATRDFVNSVITCNGSRDGIPVVGIDDSLWRDCFDTFAEEMRELLEVE